MTLEELLAKSKEAVEKMTPVELEAMKKEQAASWVRGEMAWPKARKKIVDEAIIYESYEDYLSD